MTDTNRPTALILGAQGHLGTAATQAFASAGWRVLALLRRPAAQLPPGVQALYTPLADTEALARVAAGARVVVHAVNPAYTRWPQEMLPLARQGMAVAERLGARFMLPGNVYNHGSTMPPLLSEDTPQHADTRKGRLRCVLEQEMAARATGGLRSVVIRAGDFYGGGPGSWLDLAIAKDLRRGKRVYPGPLDRPHAWAYLPDLARSFVAVAEHADPQPFRCWHFAGHTLTGAELLALIDQIADEQGLRPAGGWRLGGLPWTLLRWGGALVPMWRELAEMAYLFERPHALDGRALQQALGPLPATPPLEALRQSLRPLLSATPTA